MSSPLDKCHPFRPSISHDAAASFASAPEAAPLGAVGQQANGPEQDDDQNSWKRLKLKLKIALWAGLGCLGVFLYSYFYELLAPEVSLLAKTKKNTETFDLDDEGDWEYPAEDAPVHFGTRNVEEARKNAGILGRTFCHGARRSSFCD